MDKNATITFFAQECMEFETLGDVYENLSLLEAVKAYQKIQREHTSKGPGIGFVLEDASIPDYSGIKWPLYEGNGIATDSIDLIPAYREHPLVQRAVKEMEGYLPQLAKGKRHRQDRER